MQPGSPGQDPYNQNPQYGQDPYGQPQQPQQPQQPYGQPQYGQPQQPSYGDPYGQPQQPQYGDPYGQQPTSGSPYGQPTSGSPYGQPTSGQPYGQQAYPAQQYPGAYGQPTGQNNTQGLVGMILGIVAIPFALCCSIVGIALGIAAAVLGFMGKAKADQGLASNRGQAMAGLICGISAVVLGIISIVISLVWNVGGFNTTNF
jgi:hypothetical protein